MAVNEALAEDPALVNSDPYGEGWMINGELYPDVTVESQLAGRCDPETTGERQRRLRRPFHR